MLLAVVALKRRVTFTPINAGNLTIVGTMRFRFTDGNPNLKPERQREYGRAFRSNRIYTPQVVVNARYPGANPKVIAETVATPLEEAINGIEGMLYMSSQATTDGRLALTVTFRLGTDPDKAQQIVQNRVAQAEARLPEEVRRLGIVTAKGATDLTMVVHLVSPNERYDMTYLRNYAVLNVKDRLARIEGVGQVLLFGAGDYSMRVWLDPRKVAERGLSASDVVRAIREQNVQAAAGVVGASPSGPDVNLQLSINARGRLQSEEEFGDIIVKTEPGGAVTRLRDVARLELGASEYALRSLLNNKPAVAVPIFAAPNSNAIQISENKEIRITGNGFRRRDGTTFICRARGRRTETGEEDQEWIWSYEDVTAERAAKPAPTRLLRLPSSMLCALCVRHQDSCPESVLASCRAYISVRASRYWP